MTTRPVMATAAARISGDKQTKTQTDRHRHCIKPPLLRRGLKRTTADAWIAYHDVAASTDPLTTLHLPPATTVTNILTQLWQAFSQHLSQVLIVSILIK